MRELEPLLHNPVQVEVGGIRLTIPSSSARAWLAALDADSRTAVVALAEEAEAGDVIIAVATGDIPIRDVRKATYEALERTTGMKGYVAEKLAFSSAQRDFLGELTLAGVDPDRVTIGQWCAAVYRILTRNADPKDLERIRFELELPPPGFEDAWDDDEQYYQAMKAMAGTPGG